MKRLGSVLHTIDNLLIIRADKTLDMGLLSPNSMVFTKKMQNIGKIKEIFGPISSPYISIRISKNVSSPELMGMKNERLYLK
ncbi:MAG: Gar1/Naf1 family protein [Candidatus Methanoperedens sp.]|nr:Gar1/Naf1 family protein [Candidatus Methanoperedens sp.]PKL53955.1 MAG: H/ACA RNA-protein complex protein Gar1 [Candidatus Methanoperedenaceae archaeon HGW-Methanoperedenaceae-1]